MTAPTEQPIATRFFSGVPSMGCQCATLQMRIAHADLLRIKLPTNQYPALLTACAGVCPRRMTGWF